MCWSNTLVQTLRGALPVCALVSSIAHCGGCKEYRIEHHTRPSFYHKAATGPLPDEVVLKDGTIIKYQTRDPQISVGDSSEKGEAAKPFQIREELDGKIILRAMLPEHVLMNTYTCLRDQDYELLWEQMLSERSKRAYADEGQGLAEFTAFFRQNRNDLAATLNRMLAGYSTHEVSIQNVGDGITRCRLRPQFSSGYKYRTVDVVREGPGLKLLIMN